MHIHKGADGISIEVLPSGLTPNADAKKFIDKARELLKTTYLYVNGKKYGRLVDLPLWHVLPPSEVILKHNNKFIVIRPLNEASMSKQIQLVTNEFRLAGVKLANAHLDIQHEEITLRPGNMAFYTYLIGLGRKFSEKELELAPLIAPALVKDIILGRITPTSTGTSPTTTSTPTTSPSPTSPSPTTTTSPTTTSPTTTTTSITPPTRGFDLKSLLMPMVFIVVIGFAGIAIYRSRRYGTLIIESSIRGARVYIDDSYMGETPLKVKVKIGKHTVRVTTRGYHEYREEVILGKGEVRKIVAKLIPDIRGGFEPY